MLTNISSKIVSHLGSPNSRIPLAIKDVFNSAGYTYYSYEAGGDIEAKDRLVDEVGTGIIWLGGIPFYRKLVDKTIFKAAGISPEVDYRVVKDKNYLKKAIENAPCEDIKQEISKAGSNISKTKNLNLLKFAVSLGLTIASYLALTKAKQFMTKKNIEKEYLKKQQQEIFNLDCTKYDNMELSKSSVFNEFTGNRKPYTNVSFGSINGAIGMAEEFVLNPIKNMIILDGTISTERIIKSRTKREKKEYGMKEGSFLFFVYGADKLIKRGINAISKKLLKAPIDLDAEFLSSNLAEKILKDKNAQKNVTEFIKEFGENADSDKIYDYIFKNQDSIIVQAAKKSNVISSVKDTGTIDTRKFIDSKQIVKTAKDMDDFIKSGTLAKDTKSYLNKIKALKVGSTFLNIAICCLALGVVVPKIIYKDRKKDQNGSSSFHVKEEYEKELQAKNRVNP